ncbi:hypothetical protein PISMIDRAFT_686985 [Pisolithus microcarpus 441]|uniref:Uncharacterized protein n=1 Tax=Pisolithus microcarpus 441 TaxID=765257 RepID=A0A0C9XTU0_9AGAM|nr:hypothetical protein PISMIDRAFT_686985 [Pisolithus microcarpus 441]
MEIPTFVVAIATPTSALTSSSPRPSSSPISYSTQALSLLLPTSRTCYRGTEGSVERS